MFEMDFSLIEDKLDEANDLQKERNQLLRQQNDLLEKIHYLLNNMDQYGIRRL